VSAPHRRNLHLTQTKIRATTKLLLTTASFGLYNPRIIQADPSLMHAKED